mgnify:FL=1
MTEIPVEPIAFVDAIIAIMIKHHEIYEGFSISEEAKISFGANLAKWIQTDSLTEQQRDEAVKLTKMFILGYYWGRKHRMALGI